MPQSSTYTHVRLQFDKPQGGEKDLRHRGDVLTPNTLLICQQDISTILGGDIKPAKTHLYADNMLLYTAALIKPLTSSTLLLKHINLHYRLGKYLHSAALSTPFYVCMWLLRMFIIQPFQINYVLIHPDSLGMITGWASLSVIGSCISPTSFIFARLLSGCLYTIHL